MPLAYSPDGKLLVSGGDDKIVRFWDPDTGKEVQRLPAAEHAVQSVAFSPDGKVLAVASGELGAKFGGRVVLWEVRTAKVVRQLGKSSRIYGLVAFSPDGKTVAAAGGNSGLPGALQLWDAGTGEELFGGRGHLGPVDSVAFSADGRRVVTGGWNENIHVWDAGSGKELQQFPGYRPWLSTDGKSLLTVTGRLDVTVYLWDVPSVKPRRQFRLGQGDHVIAISPDGNTLASGSRENEIRLWDVSQGKEQRRLAGQQQLLNGLFSPDSRILACTGIDQGGVQTWLWDVATGKVLSKIADRSRNLAFSQDSKLIAGAGGGREGDDETLRLWDVATGKEVRSWSMARAVPADPLAPELSKERVVCTCFSPDGRTLATGNWKNQVRLWEVATGKERRVLEGHQGWLVRSLAFSPDGKSLVSGGIDATALVWDLSGSLAAKVPLTAEDLKSLWADLAIEDAARAYRVVWKLAGSPRQTMPLLRDRLRPAPRGDAERIARLIADLDSGRFAVREEATNELTKLGDVAEPALRKALTAGQASAEARRRLERLLEELKRWSPERLRSVRAVEVLEHIGTPEAQVVLKTLAKGDPDARLTQEAKASFDRLAKRRAAAP